MDGKILLPEERENWLEVMKRNIQHFHVHGRLIEEDVPTIFSRTWEYELAIAANSNGNGKGNGRK